MAYSRNVYLRVCSDDIAYMVFWFFTPVDATVCENVDFARMFPKFGGCLYAQMGVISNECIDDVNLL